jgi:hypothetical protein
MKTSTLTDRIVSILTVAPTSADNIWDALSDASIRRADVVTELHALCSEGVAVADTRGRLTKYSLAAQAVAS